MATQDFALRDLPDRESLTPSLASYDYDARPNLQDGDQTQHASKPADKIPLVESQPAAPAKTWSRSNILLWWLPELAATALSLISFASMIILLRAYDGHVAATLHLPRFLTLNGLLALISTINKACLTAPVASATMQEMWLYFASESSRKVVKSRLHDLNLFANASSGPVGSVVFLLRSRRTRVIACLGCVVTILSLTYSTFTQQLISLEMLPAGNETFLASIPQGETWNRWHYTGAWDEGDLFPILEMVAAIYSGALAQDIKPLLAECPSGNCTWPTTPSLAVCGECVPSTFEVYLCPPVTPGYCNYTLPSGDWYILSDYRNLTALSDDSKPTMAFAALPVSRGSTVFNATKDERAYINTWYMFGAPWMAHRNEALAFQNTECALWMCVNAYNTTVNNSIQDEASVASFDRFVTPLNSTGQLDVSINSTWRLRDLPRYLDPASVTSFTINEWALVALGAYVESAMNGTIFLEQNGQSYTGSADFMRGIWKGSSSPQAWVQSLALSMTNIVRSKNDTAKALSLSSPQRGQYDGMLYVLTIHIRWAWLVVPAALVSTSALVLGAVMVRTARSPVPSWKGSPLTLLLFNLDGRMREAAGSHLEQRNGLRRAIGHRKVRFSRAEDGLWEFQDLES